MKKLIMVGVVDEKGFDMTNRVYSGGGSSPTLRASDSVGMVLRKYETDKSHRNGREQSEKRS